MVTLLARSSNLTIQYYGETERNAYASQFTIAGISPETVEFALRGWPQYRLLSHAGASRNFLQMIVAGEAYASVDDDTECVYAHSKEFAAQVREDEGGTDPATVISFRSRAELLEELRLFELDFLSAHEQLLGRTFGAPAGQVMVTLLGVAGDCGWGSPSRYFQYQRQLMASGTDWSSAVKSREMLRTCHCYTIATSADLLMTTSFAVSGRPLMPPFSPIGRGSDVVFGRLVNIIHSTALFGHLPWGVFHSPVSMRGFSPGEQFRSAGTCDIATMLMSMLSRPVDVGEATDAFTRIGNSLQLIARSSASEFAILLNECVRAKLGVQIRDIEILADGLRSSAPLFAADADQYVLRARERLSSPQCGIPLELRQGASADEALEAARTLTGLFGSLLSAWPEMIIQGRELNGGLA
jgi:hypothetical protein